VAAADTELDRNEAATPHRLDEARRRGQVAKSADAVSTAVVAAAVVWLSMAGWNAFVALASFDRLLLAGVAQAGSGAVDLWPLVAGCIRHALVLLAPLLGIVVLAAVVANLVQTGPILAFEPLRPDWSRVSPAAGWKRVASPRTLVDAARALLKLALLAAVAWGAIAALVPQFFRVALLSPSAQARLLVDDAASLGFRLALALAFVAVLDLAWTRREHAKRLRMSRREVKDEWKNREGDPRIRNRLRELRREMLARTRSLQRTKDADLVVVNPTHLAVALRYRHGEMAAPVLLAKGAGGMAAAIRAVAARHRVPVVRHVALARALHAGTGLEQPIPPEAYAPVARLMAWVLPMREAQAASRRGASA
jgi:flagellar biosynthetic protein FlhB